MCQRRKTQKVDSISLERLATYKKKYGSVIHAYCLMSNHVHLLLESSEHQLVKFMQALQQSYSQYFIII